MKVINSWGEVPQFRTESEEHEFWQTHELGEALLRPMRRRATKDWLEAMAGSEPNGNDLLWNIGDAVMSMRLTPWRHARERLYWWRLVRRETKRAINYYRGRIER